MKSHLAANMCRIEQTVPSRTVEAEPDNVLNTLSPGRNSRWILPSELETPDRPTSSGLQSPVGAPVQLGPSPMTREYSATPPGHIPPAQWGEFYGRAGDDGFELFGAVPNDDGSEDLCPQPMMHILWLHHLPLDVSMELYFVQVMLKKNSPLRRASRVRYVHQEEFP